GAEHDWGDRPDQHRFRDARSSVASDVARHLAAAGGVTDERRLLEAEMLDPRREIVSVGVHLIAVPRLARAAVPTAIVRDVSIALGCEEDHLVLPRVGI